MPPNTARAHSEKKLTPNDKIFWKIFLLTFKNDKNVPKTNDSQSVAEKSVTKHQNTAKRSRSRHIPDLTIQRTNNNYLQKKKKNVSSFKS